MKDITVLWKRSNAGINNWKESGNQVNIVQRCVGCRCISSCPSSVDYDNESALFSTGGLKLSIGNWNCGILPLHCCYRAWILGNSMAFIFATFSPQDVQLSANINEPFPTGAKQRDQAEDVQMNEIGWKGINLWKESHDPSNSWHSACFACFMPDVVNILILKISLRKFKSQKQLLQLRPEILLIMNHHGTRHYVDVNAGACIVSTHDVVRRKESRDNNIFYQEGLLYLIPDVGSSRTLEGGCTGGM